MSILLEALRKTEQHQRPAPTIHDEEPPGSGPEPALTWPMVAMMAVALIASGWAVWRQYEAPEGVYRPPVTLAPGQAGKTQTQVAQESSVEKTPAKAEERPAPAPQKPLSEPPTREQRTPVESYRPPTSTTSAAGSSSGSADSSQPAVTTGSTASNSLAGTSANPASNTARQPAAAEPREKAAPHIPEPIGYWELPDVVRASVPEIRFSVLVYDDNPEARFVLIDGQRLGEGDELQQGLAVEEIRRDGVVFSYRLYQFLVGR
jgi:general secretion pathway protein B